MRLLTPVRPATSSSPLPPLLVRNGLLFTFLLLTSALRAQTIVENTSFNNQNGSATHPGQSVTTPGGGPYNNLSFNFYTNTLTPVAPGSLFILTQSYTGSPSNLSGATPGFLAQSTGNAGGVYTFDSAVTLAASSQYFFYANGATSGMAFSFAGNPYPGGSFFNVNSAVNNFANQATTDWAFRLQGTAVSAAPEPGTLALLALLTSGIIGIGVTRYRTVK